VIQGDIHSHYDKRMAEAIEMPGADCHYLPGYVWDIGHCGERILRIARPRYFLQA